MQLLGMSITALSKKKLQFYWKKRGTYIFSALIAIAFFVLSIYLSRNVNKSSEDNVPEMHYELSAYNQTTAYYNGTNQSDIIDQLTTAYRSQVEANLGTAIESSDVQQAILDKGIQDIAYYKEHLIVSAEFKSQSEIEAVAWYNGVAMHSAPISLNLITNALVKTYLGEEYSITASNWPLKTIIDDRQDVVAEYSTVQVQFLWFILMPMGTLIFIGSFILFPHVELSTSFAQLQFMCGVPPYVYWLVNFLVDYAMFLILTAAVSTIAFVTPYMGPKEYGVLILIFVMHGLSNIPFLYLFSRKKTASGGFAIFVVMGIFFGVIVTTTVEILVEVGEDKYITLGNALKTVFILFLPQVGLTHSVMIFCGKALENYKLDQGETNKPTEHQSYLPPLQENFLLMLASSVFYIFLIILLDTYTFKKCVAIVRFHLSGIWYKYIKRQHDDLRGYQTIPVENDDNFNSLRAKNLHKSYSGKLIVNDISFTLREKECLGILGVNGAGKTTTFRILTREEMADGGKVEIINQSKRIPIDQNKYLQNLGYCPQMNALNFVLTGREILSLMAKLRGVKDPDIVNKFLTSFELEPYADVPCGHYSGGNKRKLSLAIALIGFPKFVLLDEPTNGVDPSSRRNFWNLIRNFKEKKDLSFILTSHSMVECEALCNSLKIMKNGQFEKEGTISELKKDHGGFNIKLKLVNTGAKKNLIETAESINNHTNEVGYNEIDRMGEDGFESMKYFNTIEKLKEYFMKNKGTIKDEHSGLLHVFVGDKTKAWSSIFKEVENLKRHNPHLIEDYAIGEASLEDIFLTVARSDKETKKENRKIKKQK